MHANDRSRLILIEGLPGTGKTTLARALATTLRSGGREVVLHLEGDLHPVDHQWISRMSPSQYEEAVGTLYQHWVRSAQSEPWEAILARLDEFTRVEDGIVLTAYTKLAFNDVEMWNGLEPFRESEVHDARVGLQEYREIYRQRWFRFAHAHQNDHVAFVFECAFFQSHITELFGHHLAEENTIIAFLAELIAPVRYLNPQIHYIEAQNYADRIRTTGVERGEWLKDVVTWVETSPYGKAHGLQGFEGMMHFFEHRARIEQLAMAHLKLPVHTTVR
jgi:hypothetical protein